MSGGSRAVWIRRSATVSCAIASVLVISVLAGGSAQSYDGSQLADLAADAENAVNKGDAIAFESLTHSGIVNDLRWVKEWRESGNRRDWKAGIVLLPVRGRTPMLHISRTQLCQSTNDHLYAIAGTPSHPAIGREIPETDLMGARVVSHRLSATIEPSTGHVSIEDEAVLRRVSDTWPVCAVRLNACYTVSDARLDGIPTKYVQAGGFIFVPKPNTPTATLAIKFGATLPARGETFIAPDEAALTAYWYAHTCRLPATSDIRVVTPSSWLSIAPGRKISETVDDGIRTTRWRNDLPVSYLTLAAGRYTRTSRQSGGRTISVWLRRHSADKAEAALDQAESAIHFFSDRVARFPFEQYVVVESTVFPFGLEAYSFTLIGTRSLPHVIVHEVSHTWWGGIVPNTYTKSMWNEAFATYSESLHRRLARSDTPTGVPGEGAAEAAARTPSSIALRHVTDAMHPTHAAIGYGKGALVLEQLERMLGTPKMLETLRTFAARHPRGEAADWGDFEAAIAAVCGSDWASCIRAWLDDTRLPAFDVVNAHSPRSGNGYDVVGSLQSAPAGFWALVPVHIETETGPVDRDVLCRGTATSFSIHTTGRPTALTLDPNGVVARRSPGSRIRL